jgi:surface polysaccharide O-acyltransferase-like enzyme
MYKNATEENERGTSRQDWLDWLRVAATFSIIVLHVTTREKVRLKQEISTLDWWTISVIELITRLAVPVFFMISGFLIIGKCVHDPWRYIVPKVQKIFLVLVFWMFCYSVWEWLKNNVENPLIFSLKLFVGVPYFHLWFLLALITCYLFAPVLAICHEKWPSYSRYCLWAMPLIVGVDFVINFTFATGDYFRSSFLELGLPYIPLFFSGFLATRSGFMNTKPTVFLMIAGLAASLIAFAILKKLDVESYEKVFLPLSPSIAVASIAFFQYIFSIRKTLPLLPKWAVKLSRDSSGIYLLHPIPLDIFNHLKIYGRDPNLLFGIPILAFFVLLASWAMVYSFRVTKLDRYLLP